ncbi:hypothetical protein ACFYO1_18875 [Nocardia sp. NPDC006044]|uniref:hypothetical protein n=1 Tax=Nocardia sp. NPDC006044 TaxID=3364306 RepID=UPI0036A57FAF
MRMDTVCGSSIFARHGVGLVLLLAVPVLLCALPALRVTHGLSWVVAGVLMIGALTASAAADTVFAAFAYYLPIGVVAMLVGGFQAWHDGRNRVAAARIATAPDAYLRQACRAGGNEGSPNSRSPV